MQANKQYTNPVIDVSQLPSLQIPFVIGPQLILNGLTMSAFQNFNQPFLPNASSNSLFLPANTHPSSNLIHDDKTQALQTKTKTNWTQQQDELLKQLVEEEKLEWNDIARRIPNRTYKMCYSRYQRLREEKKLNWTPEQQKKIKELVALFGKKWKHISEFIKDRTPKQIRERYLNYLRPNLSQERWSEEQDEKLLALIKKYGHSWKMIEKHMAKRSQNQLKNRYYGKLKKLNEKSSEEEPKSRFQ